MTGEYAMTDQMNLTDETKIELEKTGGADLDYVLAFYKDGSAKLFKPKGREDIEIIYIPEQGGSQGPVTESIMAASSSCTIGGRRYIPCPF